MPDDPRNPETPVVVAGAPEDLVEGASATWDGEKFVLQEAAGGGSLPDPTTGDPGELVKVNGDSTAYELGAAPAASLSAVLAEGNDAQGVAIIGLSGIDGHAGDASLAITGPVTSPADGGDLQLHGGGGTSTGGDIVATAGAGIGGNGATLTLGGGTDTVPGNAQLLVYGTGEIYAAQTLTLVGITGVLIPVLPTADPVNEGQLWLDVAAGRVIKVSAG